MPERREPPPVKDDIAVQHRPENAASRHSAMRETGADRHGPRTEAGPEPDPAEIEAATDGRVTIRRPGERGFVGPMADDPRIRRVQTLADWLDTRFTIPVVNFPIGLDGLLGLIPGVGDTVTGVVSSYLIYEAHQAGASKRTLARMGWNVGVDWVLGAIPVVGDLFDIAHKANTKNARLLLDELRREQTGMRKRAAERGGSLS